MSDEYPDTWEEAETEALMRGLSFGLFVSMEEVIGSLLTWVRALAEKLQQGDE